MKQFRNSIFLSALILTVNSSAVAVTKGQCSASSLRARNNTVNNYRVRCDKAQANVAKYQGIVNGYQQQLPNATDAKARKSVLRNINLNTARLAAAQRSTNISCGRYAVLLQEFNARKDACLSAFPNTVTPTPGPTLNPTPTPQPTNVPGATPTPTPTPGPTVTPTPAPTLNYSCAAGSGSVGGSSVEGVCVRTELYRDGNECFSAYEYYTNSQSVFQSRINIVSGTPGARVLWSGTNSQGTFQVNAVYSVGICS